VGVLASPTRLQDLAQRLQNALGIDATQGRDKIKGVVVNSLVRKVGIVCGSGGSLLPYAREHQCDLFVTGEATFHQCLEAQANGISLLLLGHFASEKFALDHLGNLLVQNFSGLEVWSSKNENEPVVPLGY
jgi:putative NIF3 family GTP cyclohydrolase 1 type 2